MFDSVLAPASRDFCATYDRQRTTAWISFTCVLLATTGLEMLVQLGQAQPDIKQTMFYVFLVFPGSLIILPLAMLLRSWRSVEVSNDVISYTTLFRSSQLNLADVRRVAWRANAAGRVELYCQEERLIIPLYGLLGDDAKRVIVRLRNAVHKDIQEGWNVFFYCVYVGTLSGREDRRRIANEISAPAAAVAAIAGPVLVMLQTLLWHHVLPLYVLAILCSITIAVLGAILVYINAGQKRRVQRLADEYVNENGDKMILE